MDADGGGGSQTDSDPDPPPPSEGEENNGCKKVKTDSRSVPSTSKYYAMVHPLLNPVILKTLFEQCPPEALPKCRLVCKTWRDEALSALRSSKPITFEWKDVRSPFMAEDGLAISTLLEFIRDPLNAFHTKPWRKLHLKGWNFYFDHSREQIEQFWNAFGPHVTTLELTDPTFIEVEDFRKVIYQACPNLRHLVFHNPYYYKVPDGYPDVPIQEPLRYSNPLYGENVQLKSIIFDREVPSLNLHVSWMELLSHFPSLTSITINNAEYVGSDNTQALFNAVKLIRQHDPRKLILKQFEMFPNFALRHDPDTRDVFNLLRELHIPVTYLTILFCGDLDRELIKEVLRFHGNTLKKIKGVRQSDGIHLTGFPYEVELPNLKEFSVAGTICDNVEFLKCMPNLTRLRITNNDESLGYEEIRYERTLVISNTLRSEIGDVKLERLKDLMLEYAVSDEDLRSLVEWMPNVESLAIVLNDSQFSMVCQHWGNLRWLEDLGTTLTDSGITGKVGEGGGDEIRPNITALQSLTTFSSMSKNLTDVAVSDGLIKLPLLKSVTFNIDLPIMSDWIQTALRKKNIRVDYETPTETEQPMEPFWWL